MSLREDLLPTVDDLRGIADDLGLRRYRFFVRTKTWSGASAGLGTVTNVDVEILPRPKVGHAKLESKGPHEVADAAGSYRDGEYLVSNLTPAYYDVHNVQLGGYTPGQLKPRPATARNEIVYVLSGDDGDIECTLAEDYFDRPFRYQMRLKQTRRTP